MSKLYKKCPSCGNLNEETNKKCSCTADISGIEPVEYAEIYEQVCPGCGTKHYIENAENAYKKCISCNHSLRGIIPSLHKEKSEEKKPQSEFRSIGDNIRSMQDNIGAAISEAGDGSQSGNATSKAAGESTSSGTKEETPPSWGDFIASKSTLTITAIASPSVTHTLDSTQMDEDGVIIGRDYNRLFKEYLNDGFCYTEVGCSHCILYCREGDWYLKDNNSQFGTYIDGRMLEKGGETILSDGCIIRVGNNTDSPEFRVRIKQ